MSATIADSTVLVPAAVGRVAPREVQRINNETGISYVHLEGHTATSATPTIGENDASGVDSWKPSTVLLLIFAAQSPLPA